MFIPQLGDFLPRREVENFKLKKMIGLQKQFKYVK